MTYEHDAIRIYDPSNNEEIVGWVIDEWIEVPDVVFSIANACNIAGRSDGVEILRSMLSNKKVSETN